MKKATLSIIIVIVLAAALLGGGTFWFFNSHIFVEGHTFTQGEDIDLRDRDLTVNQYQQIAAEYPDARILWNIPIGDGRYDSTASSISVGNFSVDEVANFAYFESLSSVDGSASNSYEALDALQEALPQCAVSWVVRIGSNSFTDDVTDIVVTESASYDQLSGLLRFLPELKSVDLRQASLQPENCGDQLREDFPGVAFTYNVELCGQTLSSDVSSISIPGASPKELEELITAGPSFSAVECIDLGNGLYDAEKIIALREAYNGAKVLCSLNFYGVETRSDAKELDFSGIPVSDTTEVDWAVACMADLEKIIMSDCGLDNETMDALNQKHENVRIVWTVYIQGRFPCRTDAVDFAVSRTTSSYGYIRNEDVEMLKYCTDMVTLDLGHMHYDNIDFVANMPNLRFFIIGDTLTYDLSPLANCHELYYLEMFITQVSDLSPLYGLENLRHLNISHCPRITDYTQVFNLTQLDRLWWVANNLPSYARDEISAALPDVEIAFWSADNSSVDYGWRHHDSYFEMRDNLGMAYHV